MKSGKILLAGLVLIVAAVLVALQLRAEKPLLKSPAQAAMAAVPAAEAETTAASSPLAKGESGNPESEGAPDPEFKVWISSEAKQMDSPHVNSDGKTKEMERIAANLTASQSRQLLETIRNPGAPAAEKILSTYLLVEAGPRAERELKELIASPIAASGPAHSEAEMNNMRDKTLRIMALDGLFSRAQNDNQARGALAQAIELIQDPYVKKYARERYRRIEH